MRQAVVVDAIRTPIGKHGGALRDVRPDDLAALVLRSLVDRNSIDPTLIDDVFLGAANQAGEDNRNVARMAVLLAGLPDSIPGATMNRLCASGMQAVISAAREIQVGAADVVIAGGVESMSRAPYVVPKPDRAFPRGQQTMFDTTLGWRLVNPRHNHDNTVSLGETAENVADRYQISREDQDEFALRSHQRAVASRGRLSEEIIPVDVPAGKGVTSVVDVDEGPRENTSLQRLGELRPAFRPGGTVTAGNSSQLSDGAAGLLLMSEQRARDIGLSPLARFVDAASVGVDPAYMGMGPVPATRKLLARTTVEVADLDVIELNEAFASQSLACIRELGLDAERVNPKGGAIALGHPLGASGARLAATLVREMRSGGARYGLATMCVGVGQGVSAIFESADAGG
ncbi:MAG: thiolase family protein [Chloroflexota bacterium]